jgi:hypothetical protein
MLVYGIDFSEQIKSEFGLGGNNKTSVCLRDEIRDTSGVLRKKSD